MSLDRIAVRIALAGLFVAAVVVLIVTVGVMRVGSDAFASLMQAAGDTAEHAHEMFDHSVAVVVAGAAAAGVAAGVLVAVGLARRIARPIESLAAAAQRTAAGDLETRAVVDGPREVRALADAFNQLVARLAEQDEIRREFIVNASHELRTPLTNLQGYLEALRDGVLPPEPQTFDSLREEVDRLTRLAASLDLLVGAEGPIDRPIPLDLGAAVRMAVELNAPGFARGSIALDVDLDGDGAGAASGAVEVIARPDDVAQVLSNLLQNAMRYTPVGGRVGVRLEREPARSMAVVRITNSGPGIPPDDLPRIWERFYRVEKSRTRDSGGAGIGLAIVKRLVESAGGRVGATSGGGETTFWFSLPTGA